jgi:hypothetical protein
VYLSKWRQHFDWFGCGEVLAALGVLQTPSLLTSHVLDRLETLEAAIRTDLDQGAYRLEIAESSTSDG